jgi:hypothetical protein
MITQNLAELMERVWPFDLPRTEAALIRRIEGFNAEEFITLSKELCVAQADEVVLRLIFLRWAEVDLAAATAALIEMDGLSASHGAKAIAVRLMRTDAAAARRWAASLAGIEWKPEALLEIRPGVTNPFAHVLKQGLGNASRVESAAWQEIISALCRKSVTEAVEAWREASACGVTCPKLVPNMVRAMAATPEMAISFIGELSDGELAVEALASYVRNLALKSPEQALDLLTKIETGRDRDRILSELLYDAPGLVGRTCALYSDEASDFEFICMKNALVKLGTHEAVRQMTDFPELISWTRQAWEVFSDLLEKQGEEPHIKALLDMELPRPVLSGAASALATSGCTTDPKGAAELLSRYGPADDYVVDLVVESLAEAQGMDAAAALIADMPDEPQFAMTAAVMGAMKQDPIEAMEWCRVHWDPDRLDHPLDTGMRQWLRDEKSAAVEWARSHTDAAWRGRLLKIIIESEAHHHPQQCAAWIGEQFRDDSASSSDPVWVWLTALVCTQWREARLSEATEWAENLSNSIAKDAATRILRGEAHCADYSLKDE